MANTRRSNLIYVDQLQEAIPGAFAGMKALLGTGAANVNFNMPGVDGQGNRIKGGDTIRVPYFDAIGELEDVIEGQALTPVNASETSETTTVQRSGKAAEITTWAQLTAMFSDPYAELARQIAVATMRRVDKGLIDKAATATLVNDQNGSSVTADMFIDTVDQWGDEQDDVVAWFMHSKMLTSIRKLKDSQQRYLIVDPTSGNIPTLWGKPIIISDRMPTTGSGGSTVYTTACAKRGALAAWINGNPTIKTDSDILTDSDIQALHIYWATHLYKRPNGYTKQGVVLLKARA